MSKNYSTFFWIIWVIIVGMVVFRVTKIDRQVESPTEKTMIEEIPIQEEQPVVETNTDNYLVGIWQDSEMMGSGWSDHYNFYPDGKFVFYYNQMDCAKRTVKKSGSWLLENGRLVLTTTKMEKLIGGKMVESIGSCGSSMMLEDATTAVEELVKPITEVWPISTVSRSEFDNYESIEIGKNQFWKFHDDPTGNGQFERE